MDLWILAAVAAVSALLGVGLVLRSRRIETVYPWDGALLYVNGAFVRPLPPGRHTFFTLGRTVTVYRSTAFETTFSPGSVDVLTLDRFAARVVPSVLFKIVDPRRVVEGQFQHTNRLKLSLTEALVVEVAKLKLDDLLGSLPELGPKILRTVRPQFEDLEVTAVYVPSVQLPPETRRLTTEVERARLEGQAALERARGEHAALRALANAARLIKDNPDLLPLRTLQAVSQASGATIVLGQDHGSAQARPRRGT